MDKNNNQDSTKSCAPVENPSASLTANDGGLYVFCMVWLLAVVITYGIAPPEKKDGIAAAAYGVGLFGLPLVSVLSQSSKKTVDTPA